MGTPLGHDPLLAVAWCLGILVVAMLAASVLFARPAARR
jgi:hypothetical protein